MFFFFTSVLSNGLCAKVLTKGFFVKVRTLFGGSPFSQKPERQEGMDKGAKHERADVRTSSLNTRRRVCNEFR